MDSCPLVLIEWLDSRQPLAGWRKLSSFKPEGACMCASVGWLVHDGADVKALAPNMGDVADGGDMQALGIIHIPAAAVKRVVNLIEVASASWLAASCRAPDSGQKQPRSSRSSKPSDRAVPLPPSKRHSRT
jgi:hypothetical protein